MNPRDRTCWRHLTRQISFLQGEAQEGRAHSEPEQSRNVLGKGQASLSSSLFLLLVCSCTTASTANRLHPRACFLLCELGSGAPEPPPSLGGAER